MNATLTFVAFKLRPIQTSVGALPFKTTQYRHSGAFNFKASNMMPLKAKSTSIKIFADKHRENAQNWLSYIKIHFYGKPNFLENWQFLLKHHTHFCLNLLN